MKKVFFDIDYPNSFPYAKVCSLPLSVYSLLRLTSEFPSDIYLMFFAIGQPQTGFCVAVPR